MNNQEGEQHPSSLKTFLIRPSVENTHVSAHVVDHPARPFPHFTIGPLRGLGNAIRGASSYCGVKSASRRLRVRPSMPCVLGTTVQSPSEEFELFFFFQNENVFLSRPPIRHAMQGPRKGRDGFFFDLSLQPTTLTIRTHTSSSSGMSSRLAEHPAGKTGLPVQRWICQRYPPKGWREGWRGFFCVQWHAIVRMQE